MPEQNELDDPILELLALGVDPATPPTDLRERILGAAREGAEVVPLRRPRPQRAPFRLPLSAVAAIVVVALAAGVVVGDVIGRGSAQGVAQGQTTRFQLAGHGPLSNAGASVVNVKGDGFALVTFTGLPELPAGKVYELWFITPSSHAQPAAVFVPEADGSKVLVVGSPVGFSTMAVTIETGPSGVSAPTQQPQIYGTVT